MYNAKTSEPDCDFAGAALQEVITVNGLLIPMNDSTHMPTRYSTTTPADGLCASMSGMVLEVATEPSCEFEGDALQEAASMNGLSSDGQQGWQQSRTVTLLGLHSRESSQ